MLIDYFFCLLKGILLVITETLFQIILYQKLKLNDFNVLTDGKSLFELPIKNEEESYEKIIDTSNNNDYKTGNLLDFAYLKKKYINCG